MRPRTRGRSRPTSPSVDRSNFELVIRETIELAYEYSLETRIRRLLAEHYKAGYEPRTLVMNERTWHNFVIEVEGFRGGYLWSPPGHYAHQDVVSTYRGIPILVKAFVADQEVLVGV